MSDVFVGVDVGGTSIKCALAHEDGTILEAGSIATNSHEGPHQVLRRIGDYVSTLTSRLDVQPKALGMGLPGLVDTRRGVTQYLPNLTTHWKNIPAADLLRQQLGYKVLLLNDVRTATYGELVYGHGRNAGPVSMMFMAIGTGIGGGIVIDGKLRIGSIGAAGEIGHQTIDPTGPLCGCGNHGCLETLASGTALAAEGIRLMLMGLAPALHEKVKGDPGMVTAEAMGQVAEEDDAIRQAILHAGFYLAIGIANVVVTIHPDMVVIGGGVAQLGELLLGRVRRDLKERVGRLFSVDNLLIETSQLGSRAGVLGAIALASRGLPE